MGPFHYYTSQESAVTGCSVSYFAICLCSHMKLNLHVPFHKLLAKKMKKNRFILLLYYHDDKWLHLILYHHEHEIKDA